MKNQQNTINLQIAGFSIKLYSDTLVELEDGYTPFVEKNAGEKADVTVECIAGLPVDTFENAQLVFEAENGEQKYYSIYRIGEKLGFIIYNQETKNDIQQVAVLNEDFSTWNVYSELTDTKFNPLKFPFGPILMHYMTLKSDAVMMHASCAFDGSVGRIFTGFSGAGKSTMSKIWSNEGNLIINDDRLIIRKHEDGYFVYNTPMYYMDLPKKAPLKSVFLISHSPQNRIKKLSGALAISKMMAFSIQNNYDKQFIQNRLSLFTDLCSHVSVYELGFVPDQNVVNFVLTHETRGDK
jgi:hypothetical protein